MRSDYPCWRLDFKEVETVLALTEAEADKPKQHAPPDGSMYCLKDRTDANGWRYQCAIVRDERIRPGLFLSLGACPPEGGPPAVLIESAYTMPPKKRAKGRAK